MIRLLTTAQECEVAIFALELRYITTPSAFIAYCEGRTNKNEAAP